MQRGLAGFGACDRDLLWFVVTPSAQSYKPVPFELSVRLPVVLNTLFIVQAFCSGMPVLLPIGFCSLVVMYWIDKFTLLRLYGKPPNMGEDVARVGCSRTVAVLTVAGLLDCRGFFLFFVFALQFANGLLIWALLLHLAIGIWMYGDANTLQSGPVRVGNSAWEQKYDDYVSGASKDDAIGLVPKLLRANVFPIAVLFFAIVAVKIIRKFIAGPILAVI